MKTHPAKPSRDLERILFLTVGAGLSIGVRLLLWVQWRRCSNHESAGGTPRDRYRARNRTVPLSKLPTKAADCLFRERLNGRGFIVFHIKDGVELRNL